MFDAYKIGVTLSLTNHVSRGLAAMAADFEKTGKQVKDLDKKISSMQSNALKGGLMIGAGVGMLALLKGPLEEAKKYDQAIGKFKLFGLSDAQNAEAVEFARSTKIMGASYTDMIQKMTEAQGIFRESGLSGSEALAGAKLAAPMLAKIDYAMSSLDEESQAKMKTQSMAMLRFTEMRGGLKNAKAFNEIADNGFRAITSSGGNVNFEQLRQFMARGGVSAQGLSDRALYAHLEPIIGELKGSTAGNALMTSYNRLIGAVKVPNQVAHMLADNGIWDSSKIVWNSQGGIKTFTGNPLKNMSQLASDPTEFYEKTILPMYAKMNGGKGLNNDERNRDNLMIFGRTGGAMYSLIDRQLATIHKSAEAFDKTLGVDAADKVADKTLAGQEKELHANWNKALTDLGLVVLPMAIRATESLSSGLRSLTGWMDRNKTTTQFLVTGFTALAGALMVGGSIRLLTAGLQGLNMIVGISGGVGVLGSISKLSGAFALALGPMGAFLLMVGSLGFAYARISDAIKNRDNPEDAKTNGGAVLSASARSRIAAGEADGLTSKQWTNPNASGFVMPRGNDKNGTVHTSINIDGRKIADATSPYFASPLGSSNFGFGSDLGLAMPMPGNNK